MQNKLLSCPQTKRNNKSFRVFREQLTCRALEGQITEALLLSRHVTETEATDYCEEYKSANHYYVLGKAY